MTMRNENKNQSGTPRSAEDSGDGSRGSDHASDSWAGAAVARRSMGVPADTEGAAQAGANWKPQFFDAHQNETLITLTDLIIPATDTPGAKAALVNRYLDLLYNEETGENQQEIIQALAWFDGRSLSLHNKPFVSLTKAQQTALLKPLADPSKAIPEDEAGVKAFDFIKELTIFGYYTSKIGLDEELRYQGDTYNTSFPGACTHPEHQS